MSFRGDISVTYPMCWLQFFVCIFRLLLVFSLCHVSQTTVSNEHWVEPVSLSICYWAVCRLRYIYISSCFYAPSVLSLKNKCHSNNGLLLIYNSLSGFQHLFIKLSRCNQVTLSTMSMELHKNDEWIFLVLFKEKQVSLVLVWWQGNVRIIRYILLVWTFLFFFWMDSVLEMIQLPVSCAASHCCLCITALMMNVPVRNPTNVLLLLIIVSLTPPLPCSLPAC